MRWFLLLLALSLAAPLVGAPRVRASDFWDEVRTPGLGAWREDVARARAALRARRLDQARAAADDAARRLPQRAEAYVVRALAAGEQGDLPTAMRDLERALSLDAASLDDVDDAQRAGEIAARSGAYALAARVLERTLARMRAGTARQGLYRLYGDVLLCLGPERLDDAIRAYREAMRSTGSQPLAALGLALALHRSGEAVEWRDHAHRVAARGRLDNILSSLFVTESERWARRAVVLEAIEDAAAREAWSHVEGPWAEHAATAQERLTPARRRGR